MPPSVQETNSWELFIPRFLKVSTALPQVDWAELSEGEARLGCTFRIGTVPATRFVGCNLGAGLLGRAVAVAGWPAQQRGKPGCLAGTAYTCTR